MINIVMATIFTVISIIFVIRDIIQLKQVKSMIVYTNDLECRIGNIEDVIIKQAIMIEEMQKNFK